MSYRVVGEVVFFALDVLEIIIELNCILWNC